MTVLAETHRPLDWDTYCWQ